VVLLGSGIRQCQQLPAWPIGLLALPAHHTSLLCMWESWVIILLLSMSDGKQNLGTCTLVSAPEELNFAGQVDTFVSSQL
jgi:hypothetical protein